MPTKSGSQRKRTALLLLLALTGCALRVPVRQLRLPDKLPPEELGALRAIYLVLRLADAETASPDKLSRAVALAAEIRRALEGPSSRVVAYQITAPRPACFGSTCPRPNLIRRRRRSTPPPRPHRPVRWKLR